MSSRKRKKGLRIVLGILLVLGLVAGGVGYRYYHFIKSPNVSADLPNDGFFYIPTGATFEDVVIGLKSKGLLLQEESFRWVAEKKNYLNKVKPGRYKLSSGMNNNELVNLLRSGEQEPVNVTFNNIRDLPELAGRVSKYLEPDSAVFSQFLLNDSVITHYGFNRATFLALFIPNTYEFYWNTTPEAFLKRMASEFKVFWTAERKAKAKRLGLSQSDVATLASIVQAETVKHDEMPMVAGLYINRLKKGMKLQADPTVKYAVGDPGLKRIYFKHLEIDSPYNTYKYKGLPPGPIAVPEKQALEAVLNAADHNYLFMCAKPDYSGYHNFAQSLSAHNANRSAYIRFLQKEGIR